MTMEEIRALMPATGRRSYAVQFRDKRTTLVFDRFRSQVILDGTQIAGINVPGILVPMRFSSTSTRELLDLFGEIELADSWNDDPLDL